MEYTAVEIKVLMWALLAVMALIGAFFMIWKVYRGLPK